MNKTSKFILVVLLTLSMLLPSIASVRAVEDEEEYRAEFSLTTENVNVKEGDEVFVKLNIVSITGFKGIATFTGEKVYDDSVFEYIDATAGNGWTITAQDKNIIVNSGETHDSGTIVTMKFRAKKEAEDSTIKVIKIDAGGDDFDGEAAGVCYKDNNVNEPSVSFKVTAVTDPGPEEPDPEKPGPEEPGPEDPDPEKPDPEEPGPEDPDPEKPGTEDPGTEKPKPEDPKPDTGSNTNNGNTNNNDKTTAKGDKIPQTGEPYMVIVTLVITIALAGGLFIKYKLFSNKMK